MTTVAVEAIDKSWEALADMARGLLDEQDRQRWALGEIADLVHTSYGEGSIEKFCVDVKAKPQTLYQYRQVFRFYPRDVWMDYKTLRYTQWRDAMYALKNAPEAALALLIRANDADMPMRQFYAELRRLAGKTISTPEKIFDKVVELQRRGDTVTFVCDAVLVEGVRYQITIREATDV